MNFEITPYLIWLSVCSLAGLYGYKTGFGFLKGFLLAIFVTPFIAVIIMSFKEKRS